MYKGVILEGKYMEQEPLTNISSTTSVQVDRLERAYSQGRFFKAIIFILLIIIIVSVFFIYSLLTKSAIIPEYVSSLLMETVVCKNCDTKETEEDMGESSSMVTLKNQGWAIYQFPKYGVSVEIPNISTIVSTEGSPRYVWSVYSYEMAQESNNFLLPDYLNTIVVSYNPIEIHQIELYAGVAIYVNMFNNIERLKIEEVERIFSENVYSLNEDNPEIEDTYTSSFTTSYFKDSFTYEYEDVTTSNSGIILLTDKYIVQIDKTNIFSVEQDLEIVNTVLKSMKFN